jgi:hypothetical protein
MSTSRRTFLLAVTLLATAGACGPSAAELRQARETQYSAPREQVFGAARNAVAASYPIAQEDPEAGVILTAKRWHEPDGSYLGTNDDDRRSGVNVVTESGSVELGFRVRVVGDEPPFQVVVEPVAAQVRANYSRPYEYLPDDPAMPGWIVGKVDNLQLAVHQRLAAQLPHATTVATP